MVSAVRARGAGGWRSFLEFYLALALLCFPFKAFLVSSSPQKYNQNSPQSESDRAEFLVVLFAHKEIRDTRKYGIRGSAWLAHR